MKKNTIEYNLSEAERYINRAMDEGLEYAPVLTNLAIAYLLTALVGELGRMNDIAGAKEIREEARRNYSSE